MAWLGLAWLGLAWLGSARLGSARLGSARLGSARLLKVNTAILSGHARSHLCLAYVVGLNFLTYACFLLDDDEEITKSALARRKFLIFVL